MKHLLNKNGASKSPELDDDAQCEALLNSLAKQQRQSSVIEESPPPLKRQRFLGVNKNNEVIIVDDQASSSPASSPQKRPSSPVRSQHAVSFYGMPSKVDISPPQAAATSNGCIVGTGEQLKALTAQQHLQPCGNQAAVVDEVICIDDDDDDDSVLLVTDSPKTESHSGVSLVSDKKPSANAVVCESLSAVKSSCSSVNGKDDSTGARVDDDDTAHSEQLPSSSDQITDSCLSTPPSVAGQQHASEEPAAASTHSSPSSRKVIRLENLLKVGFCAALDFCLKLIIYVIHRVP